MCKMSNPALSFRIVTCDHYQSPPVKSLDETYSEFSGSEIENVPIIRIFGVTSSGKKTCLHVHGIFPYFSVPYAGETGEEAVRFMHHLARSVDKALNRNSKAVVHHIYKVLLVSAVPFYGYHEEERCFLRLYFYNPLTLKRAVELFHSGAVLDGFFQPHEAHIPYIMQFFIDFNLFGMDFIHLSNVSYRQSVEQSHLTDTSPLESRVMLHKSSTCEIEGDCCSAHILNVAQEFGTLNPGLESIWKTERQRRLEFFDESRITPSLSQERPLTVVSKSEEVFQEKLKIFVSSLDLEQEVLSSPSVSRSMEDQDSIISCGNLSQFLDSHDMDLVNLMVEEDSILCTQTSVKQKEEGESEEEVEMSQEVWDCQGEHLVSREPSPLPQLDGTFDDQPPGTSVVESSLTNVSGSHLQRLFSSQPLQSGVNISHYYPPQIQTQSSSTQHAYNFVTAQDCSHFAADVLHHQNNSSTFPSTSYGASNRFHSFSSCWNISEKKTDFSSHYRRPQTEWQTKTFSRESNGTDKSANASNSDYTLCVNEMRLPAGANAVSWSTKSSPSCHAQSYDFRQRSDNLYPNSSMYYSDTSQSNQSCSNGTSPTKANPRTEFIRYLKRRKLSLTNSSENMSNSYRDFNFKSQFKISSVHQANNATRSSQKRPSASKSKAKTPLKKSKKLCKSKIKPTLEEFYTNLIAELPGKALNVLLSNGVYLCNDVETESLQRLGDEQIVIRRLKPEELPLSKQEILRDSDTVEIGEPDYESKIEEHPFTAICVPPAEMPSSQDSELCLDIQKLPARRSLRPCVNNQSKKLFPSRLPRCCQKTKQNLEISYFDNEENSKLQMNLCTCSKSVCDTKVEQQNIPTSQQQLQVKKRGRPRKYPVGFKQTYVYKNGVRKVYQTSAAAFQKNLEGTRERICGNIPNTNGGKSLTSEIPKSEQRQDIISECPADNESGPNEEIKQVCKNESGKDGIVIKISRSKIKLKESRIKKENQILAKSSTDNYQQELVTFLHKLSEKSTSDLESGSGSTSNNDETDDNTFEEAGDFSNERVDVLWKLSYLSPSSKSDDTTISPPHCWSPSDIKHTVLSSRDSDDEVKIKLRLKKVGSRILNSDLQVSDKAFLIASEPKNRTLTNKSEVLKNFSEIKQKTVENDQNPDFDIFVESDLDVFSSTPKIIHKKSNVNSKVKDLKKDGNDTRSVFPASVLDSDIPLASNLSKEHKQSIVSSSDTEITATKPVGFLAKENATENSFLKSLSPVDRESIIANSNVETNRDIDLSLESKASSELSSQNISNCDSFSNVDEDHCGECTLTPSDTENPQGESTSVPSKGVYSFYELDSSARESLNATITFHKNDLQFLGKEGPICNFDHAIVTPAIYPPSYDDILNKQKQNTSSQQSSSSDDLFPQFTLSKPNDTVHSLNNAKKVSEIGGKLVSNPVGKLPQVSKSGSGFTPVNSEDVISPLGPRCLNRTISVELHHENEEHQYLTVMSLEIHVETRSELRPDPKYDPINAVFFSIRNDTSGEDYATNFDGAVVVDLFYNRKCPDLNSYQIYLVGSELELFEKTIEIIKRWDPDIVCGYEVKMLSWGYMLERASHLEEGLVSRFSRLPSSDSKKSAAVFNHSLSQESWLQSEYFIEIEIKGRVVLNLWKILRSEVALNVYSFENFYYHAFHQRLSLFSVKTLTEWFKNLLTRWRVVDYYMVRVLGNIRLLDHFNIIQRTSEFSRIYGIQFFEVFSRGSQFRVESMMLRMTKSLGYLPVSPSMQQRARARAPECLQLILEPESKFYKDPVVVLDFQALYPSIIIAYNYCYSTCLGRLEHFDKKGSFEFGCVTLEVPQLLLKKLHENVTVSPNGVVFVNSSVRQGVLPRMLQQVLNTRIMVKKVMKDHKDYKALKKRLDAQQLGLKLIANTSYGYTAAHYSGRMPCVEVGDSIVSKARETLEQSIRLVESRREWGARVVYGDTDSMFVHLPGKSKEEAFAIGHEIADAVTAVNPKPVKLKFEKVYLPCVLQTKKRYVGFMYETLDQKDPVFDAKGIETVRRDNCPAVKKILEQSVRILFSTYNSSLVKQFVQRQFQKILTNRINLQEFVFAKEYRGRSGYRPNACVPALEVAKRLTQNDPRAEPLAGDRVPYVIVYGEPGLPLIKLVRQPLELLWDSNLKINNQYYITRVIIPPLDRIFSLLSEKVHLWFSEMQRLKSASILRPMTSIQKGSLTQYFSTASCACCEESSTSPLCTRCRNSPHRTVVTLLEKVRSTEREVTNLKKICSSCAGFRRGAEACISADCPVIFRLSQGQRDDRNASYLYQIVSDLNRSVR